jgi:hypothetical protein
MSHISLKGLFGALCVLATIAVGVGGLLVALVVAAVRSSSGSIGFATALKRVMAGPIACTAIGLVALAWLAVASSNDTVDAAGPWIALVGLLGGVVAGVAVAKRLPRSPAA